MIRINGEEVSYKTFPDRTPSMLNLIFPKGYILQSDNKYFIEWRYENNMGELFDLWCLVKWLQEQLCVDPKNIVLFMPYIPNARMDRIGSDRDVLTLKFFSDIINQLKFNKVLVLDPHSGVSLALIDRVVKVPVEDYIHKCVDNISKECGDNLIIVYPDEGSVKRYNLNYPYVIGVKRRSWITGKIESLTLLPASNSESTNNSDVNAVLKEMLKHKNVLIIDDICCKGGTFNHIYDELKKYHVDNVYFYVTHLEQASLDSDLFLDAKYKHLYTTDSLLFKPRLAESQVKIVESAISRGLLTIYPVDFVGNMYLEAYTSNGGIIKRSPEEYLFGAGKTKYVQRVMDETRKIGIVVTDDDNPNKSNDNTDDDEKDDTEYHVFNGGIFGE